MFGLSYLNARRLDARCEDARCLDAKREDARCLDTSIWTSDVWAISASMPDVSLFYGKDNVSTYAR